MKIGVIDSDGDFTHPFFKDKNINQVKVNSGYNVLSRNNFPYSHSEYVCASILKENPEAEIVLRSIIGKKQKNTYKLLIDGINNMIAEDVDIINLSVGVEVLHNQDLLDVCKKAESKKIPIVAAHSNYDAIAYPASLNNVIGVYSENNKSTKFIDYDCDFNNIKFNCDLTSYYQLDQVFLLKGNSFCTATMTGILSKYIGEYQESIQQGINYLFKSPINEINVISYRNESSVCFTDVPNSNDEIKYIKNNLNCKDIVDISDAQNYLYRNHYMDFSNTLCFIDINSYSYINKNRKYIDEFVINVGKKFKGVVFRYPYYNVKERMFFLENYEIKIIQFAL